MGCKELIESLHQAGDEKIRAIREGAGREAEQIRAEAERRIAEVRAEDAAKQAEAVTRHTGALLAEAGTSARLIRLRAERNMADRLYGLACSSLGPLRNGGYGEVFSAFVRELPRFAWKSVRVNPGDADLARKHFPGAEVALDEGITGGLVAATEGGQVRVVNTFEKRLERLWDEMLPEIMQEVSALCE